MYETGCAAAAVWERLLNKVPPENRLTAEGKMTVKELSEKLNWKLICGDGGKDVSGCYIGDLLSRVMGNCGDSDIWITVQTSRNMIAVAVLADVAAVLFPEGIQVSEQVIDWAREEQITLAGCGKPAFETAAELAAALDMKAE